MGIAVVEIWRVVPIVSTRPRAIGFAVVSVLILRHDNGIGLLEMKKKSAEKKKVT